MIATIIVSESGWVMLIKYVQASVQILHCLLFDIIMLSKRIIVALIAAATLFQCGPLNAKWSNILLHFILWYKMK